MYPILNAIFFLSVLFSILLATGSIFRPKFWIRHGKKISYFGIAWMMAYFTFIIFFTGPVDLDKYPTAETSPYKLPWAAGVERFVAQGNRSFVSHRGLHLYAWDFVMPIGTKVLAAREGTVVEVEVSHDGIGYLANYITISHADGDRTGYAHLQKESAFVKVGDHVKQGQAIGLSGMVGQTLFPHLHFFATAENGSVPKAISFREVPGGIPFAGHFYKSANTEQ